MKFSISFCYGILNAMKDGFIVTAKGSGAEAIPVLKGWIVLPCAVGATVLYSKLTNRFSRSQLFYGIILFFLSFIALYGFVLYPYADALSPHQSADWLLAQLGEHNSHWIAIYRNWIPSLFFVVTELWGSVVIFLLFWGFVNQVNTFGEAKRFYNLFIAGGDMAQMLTGPTVYYFTRKFIGSNFIFALHSLTGFVLFFGCIIMALFWYLNRSILTDIRFYNPADHHQDAGEVKTKLSFRESLRLIVGSKYLRAIAMMVIGYALTINLVDVTWKGNLKLAFPDTGAYQGFMAAITSSVGICSFITTTLLSGPLIRLLGWRFSALVTPIIVGSTSLLFLFLFDNRDALGPTLWGYPTIAAIVLLGAFQNVSSKVCKYAFFDATKEMSYIPLSHELKVKGKAAIDVVGSRFGKAGASWLQIALLQFAGTGSVFSITSYLLPIIAVTVLLWILAVRSLNRQFSGDKQLAI